MICGQSRYCFVHGSGSGADRAKRRHWAGPPLLNAVTAARVRGECGYSFSAALAAGSGSRPAVALISASEYRSSQFSGSRCSAAAMESSASEYCFSPASQ